MTKSINKSTKSKSSLRIRFSNHLVITNYYLQLIQWENITLKQKT
jgi:hypothetical protein